MKLHSLLLVCFLSFSIISIGCNRGASNPGTWDQAQVEAQIKKSLNLSEATLTPAEGGFSGTGKNAEGENFKFTIKQDAANKRMEWKSEGDRGSFEDGYYEVD